MKSTTTIPTRKIDKEILRIAVPSIVTNITVPLLGLIDVAISGHLQNVAYIGAVAAGGMMFNLAYWSFGFLRMGTTGITAQAYGENSVQNASSTLHRSVLIALLVGIVLILSRVPVSEFLLRVISPSAEVEEWARRYYNICVWGAPALLCTMVIKGWILGLQNAAVPMIVSISVNLLNIAFSFIAVFVVNTGFVGIAYGTLLAEWCGFIIALALMIGKFRHWMERVSVSKLLDKSELMKFFHVNSDIFFRSLIMLSVTLAITAVGARAGDIVLAINAVVMQLFMFFAYLLDGFAFSGEALVGKYIGANDRYNMHRVVKRLFVWGMGVAAIFVVLYAPGLPYILRLLTDEEVIFNGVLDCRIWCVLFVIIGIVPFVWDGVFIGLTATRQMLICTILATAVFFGVYFYAVIVGENTIFSNARLWLSFVLYLGMRGVVLTYYYCKNYLPRNAIENNRDLA
ncbi:MAG: MATE family efflux transporter [Muribaculaceae bacterium]|nr:MATE family efflux transporter [Muribaculaceae bacterium]